jgi:hypothetical protein
VACSNSANTARHLQHHPPGCGAGVEWLRRRAQHNLVGVEFLGELGELAHLARQPVDAVDEQQVDPAVACEIECCLEAGPLELDACRTVFVVGDDPPALLRRAERLKRSRCECRDVGWFSSSVEMQV